MPAKRPRKKVVKKKTGKHGGYTAEHRIKHAKMQAQRFALQVRGKIGGGEGAVWVDYFPRSGKGFSKHRRRAYFLHPNSASGIEKKNNNAK
ncbi:MAG: hypothetical protein JW772_02185 [Candidatus Diapherotrites archaeon]|nr:hypothetical protein [Candidatus Diapherotrites archaeon]